ncbi:MAG TPA: hypothetical protein PLV86_00085 [Candidatus Fermentibacter daniensis]|nr:hypothetical protein [Candidatus Fermentibacter daniensis]HOG55645.1 hypothetical protein [Candidatus Fermentibacter daniensis]HQM40146.1 hypothetical protein [Candidatus Fermentibacter daniensis]
MTENRIEPCRIGLKLPACPVAGVEGFCPQAFQDQLFSTAVLFEVVREGFGKLSGHGIGREIVGPGVEWLGSRGADLVTVATQGDGGGSIRLYESAGFRMNRIPAWFHYWSSRGRRQ